MTTKPQYQNFQVHGSKPQTHADELDGTTGRGEFNIQIAQEVVAVVGTADVGLNWTVELQLIDPSVPASFENYELASEMGTDKFYAKLNLDIPPGAKLLVKTSNLVGSNPKTQLITKLLQERGR